MVALAGATSGEWAPNDAGARKAVSAANVASNALSVRRPGTPRNAAVAPARPPSHRLTGSFYQEALGSRRIAGQSAPTVRSGQSGGTSPVAR